MPYTRKCPKQFNFFLHNIREGRKFVIVYFFCPTVSCFFFLVFCVEQKKRVITKRVISSKNTNPTFRTFLPFGTFPRQSITKIQSKDREQPPVEKNYTDLDKVLSELFRPLIKNYLPLFLVVFSSFKVIPSHQKINY